MSKKEIMKEVFNQEFDIKSMRNEILMKEEAKQDSYLNNYCLYILPACLIIFIFCVASIPLPQIGHKTLPEIVETVESLLPDKEVQNRNIKINNLDNISLTKIDADIKEITNGINIVWPEFLKDGISIPEYLDKTNSSAIYTRKDTTSNYDILNCYVYNYFNSESNRNIRMSFSKNNKPIRDYRFEEKGEYSEIRGIKLSIYQHEETYFTEFKYKSYNFDIETNGISLDELTSLLESIIK